jgi:hypothetical protein
MVNPNRLEGQYFKKFLNSKHQGPNYRLLSIFNQNSDISEALKGPHESDVDQFYKENYKWSINLFRGG